MNATPDDARLEGFADCEELVAAMLERMAQQEEGKIESWSAKMQLRLRETRAQVLREAALAVRLGQHRAEPEART